MLRSLKRILVVYALLPSTTVLRLKSFSISIHLVGEKVVEDATREPRGDKKM